MVEVIYGGEVREVVICACVVTYWRGVKLVKVLNSVSKANKGGNQSNSSKAV